MIYLIQEHFASHHHYDLRLEMDNVLKSWALSKEPPQIAGIRRLAVEVEDHPLAYADFEGIIPEGFYGAGKVIIWDKGEYELIERSSSKIIINIKGQKLKGRYCLLRFQDQKKNWLFFKMKEEKNARDSHSE